MMTKPFTVQSLSKYRHDIDGLRAVAVLGVVIFHAFPAILRGGFVGVDVFFVISGYLIASLIFRGVGSGTFSFGDFYARRIKRIFPALILMLVACYAFSWFNLLDTEFEVLGKHIAGASVFASNLVLWSEAGYFDASANSKPLLHLWSLGVEEQFYIIWPALVWLSLKLRARVPWVIACIGIPSFVLNLVLASASPVADFYSPLSRIWEPMLGCLLAWQHQKGISIFEGRIHLKSIAGGSMILFPMFLFDNSLAFPGGWGVIPVVGAYLVIDSGPSALFNARVLGARVAVWVGLVSFPLYLYHWPLLSFGWLMEGHQPSVYYRVAAIFASILLSWLTWKLVERPVRHGHHSRVKIAVLLVCMVIIGLQGFSTYRRHGLGFRFSGMVSGFTRVDFDLKKSWRRHQCFLEGDEDGYQFAPSCSPKGGQPLVSLWGDSHAAAIYPGLQPVTERKGIRLSQYTASGCPPLLGGAASDKRCVNIQDRAFLLIKESKPRLVIITANWDENSLGKIDGTVAALRRETSAKIVMLGPVPRWSDALPKTYWLYWRKRHEILPERSLFGLDEGIIKVDKAARQKAKELNISYISAYEALCNGDGCLTRTGTGKGKIVTFDDSHLTPWGAEAQCSELKLVNSTSPW